MIIWIASYPKSGNTWLRSLLSTYFYSNDGVFSDTLLKEIDQFPTSKYIQNYKFDKKIPTDTCKYWIKAQQEINAKKKIKFFKTHNTFGKVNGHDFTNEQNSIGGIYVVRDPRNVITSLSNHYQINYDEAYNWMTNERNFIYNFLEFEKYGYSDFQFISSWSTNLKSWTTQKKIPIKLIKYEDLLNQTYRIFVDVIEFIFQITNSKEKINKEKIKKTLKTTSFEVLKKNEEKNGFSEAVVSHQDKSKKVSFFHLGPKNNWKTMLDSKLKNKIEIIYEKELKDLKYLL